MRGNVKWKWQGERIWGSSSSLLTTARRSFQPRWSCPFWEHRPWKKTRTLRSLYDDTGVVCNLRGLRLCTACGTEGTTSRFLISKAFCKASCLYQSYTMGIQLTNTSTNMWQFCDNYQSSVHERVQFLVNKNVSCGRDTFSENLLIWIVSQQL